MSFEPRTRNEFGQLLADRGLLGPAVEVGVHAGLFAEEILSWGVEQLYMVDLWRHVKDGTAELEQSDEVLEEVFQSCLERNKKDLDRIVVLRGDSCRMSAAIMDDSVDFVFFDATHTYPAVKADMNAYWPKLRVGGIYAGHDYVPALTVREAVNEFALDHGGMLHLAMVSRNDVSYWFEKKQ